MIAPNGKEITQFVGVIAIPDMTPEERCSVLKKPGKVLFVRDGRIMEARIDFAEIQQENVDDFMVEFRTRFEKNFQKASEL